MLGPGPARSTVNGQRSTNGYCSSDDSASRKRRAGETTSVNLSPNSSSITTTSPLAMRLPFTSKSTASPARRLRETMLPGPRARVSPMVIRVRPISTASSTGTSSRRWRSAARCSDTGGASSAAYSISCDTGLPPLLDGDVGEEDLVHLHVGPRADCLQNQLLEVLTATAVDQVLGRLVGDHVGDHVAHGRLLLEGAVVAVRARGSV